MMKNTRMYNLGILAGLLVVLAVSGIVSAVAPSDPQGIPAVFRTTTGLTSVDMNLPRAGSAHYNVVWSTSHNIDEFYASGVSSSGHVGNGLRVYLKAKNGTWVVTSFTVPGNVNGTISKVRNVWWSLDMPKGVNVTAVEFSSGSLYWENKYVTFAGNDTPKDYQMDLGKYYTLQRGFTIAIYIKNDKASVQSLKVLGAGLMQEW